MVARRRRTGPSPIKIFCGLIGNEEAFARATELLTGQLGDIDCESPVLPFDFTAYYSDEMGPGLLRKWIAFRPLRERGASVSRVPRYRKR